MMRNDSNETTGTSSCLVSHGDNQQQQQQQRLRTFHQAIQNGEWNSLPELLKNKSTADLWWHANASGWTAVHFAASQFLPLSTWDWILRQATADTAKNQKRLTTQRNHVGQTVLDVCVQTALTPLPWQAAAVQHSARRTHDALQYVVSANHGDALLDKIRTNVQATLQKVVNKEDCFSLDAQATTTTPIASTAGDIMVERSVRVVCVLQILATAAGQEQSQFMKLMSQCNTNALPKVLAEFLWHLYPTQATGATLQHWATTKHHLVTHPFTDAVPAWLRALYQVHGQQEVFVNINEDDDNVFVAAVATGKSLPTLQFLRQKFQQHHNHHDPSMLLDALIQRDHSQRQPNNSVPVAVVALIRARCEAAGLRVAGLGSCVYQLWPAARQEAARQAAAAAFETEELSVVYTILRQDLTWLSGIIV